MSCCAACGTNKFFSKQAKRYAKRFRKKGLDNIQKLLASSLKKLGITSRSILEIGCGVGGLHQKLLTEGASSAVGVDISGGMLEQARILATEQSLGNRVDYILGDVVSMDGEISVTDVVILDKVVCCYPDLDLLLRTSMNKCRTYLAVSYPREAIIAKLFFKSGAKVGEWLRWSFHPYYHEPSQIEGKIHQRGFEDVDSATTIMWQTKVYGRVKSE